MSTSATMADAIGVTVFRVSPRRREIAPIRARPIRPLPSVNGWMDSKWARAIAACAMMGTSRRLQKTIRSSISPGTSSGWGGTRMAPRGEWSLPPIQF